MLDSWHGRRALPSAAAGGKVTLARLFIVPSQGGPLPAVAAKLHILERRTSCTAAMAPNRIFSVSGLHCSTNES